MRCVKFERTKIKPNPISSSTSKPLSLPTSSETNLQANLTPKIHTALSTLATKVATHTPNQNPTSTLRSKLTSPISAVSVGAANINIKTVSKGQSTRSQATKIVDMSTKVASKSENKSGGRHPHPPNGNNKKLKHMCPFDGCLWRFATPYKLRRHIKSHTKETPYLCEECGRGFSVRYNLLMHIQTIHNQPQRHKCPVRGCKEAFHSQPRLNGHLRRVHKRDVKPNEKPTERCDSRGNSTSSMDSIAEEEVPAVRNPRQRRKFVCSECRKEFQSQAKLTLHMRIHSEGKSTGQDKEVSKEKASKHSDSHKNGRQFACPHENCNRVFLHQSHLKNHLKIHTKDHQFVCPVLDCSKRFSCEAEYNSHITTHINLGYKCPHPDCKLSFLSKKRLIFHTQVVHSNQRFHDGAHSSFLEGIRPHLGVHHQSSHLLSPVSCSSVFSYPQHLSHDPANQPIKSEQNSYDFVKDFDLPGRSQKYFESVLSQNQDWSGEQIDRFLHSAVDLSEVEARLSSTGYESDSGYSTFDVSPTATNPPLSVTHPLQSTPLQHTTGPMFSPFSPTSTVFPDGLHSAAPSPASTEMGIYSPHPELESMANTPIQTASFFPVDAVPHPGVQMYIHPHPQAVMFGVPRYMVGESSAHPRMQEYLNSRVPELLVHSDGHLEPKENSRFVSYRRNSDSQVNFGENFGPVSRSQLLTQSLPNMGQLAHVVKTEPHYSNPCAVSASSHVTSYKEEVHTCPTMDQQLPVSHAPHSNGDHTPHSNGAHTPQSNGTHAPFSNGSHAPHSNSGHTPLSNGGHAPHSNGGSSHIPGTRLSMSRATKMKGTKKGKSSSKSGQRRKNQWPRSMNQANMMAFRQHILNRLKKGQESTSGSYGIKQEAGSPKPMGEAGFVMGGSESEDYEVQVKVQRNHSSDSRSRSAPIEGSSPSALPLLLSSQSDSNVSQDKALAVEVCSADTTHLSDLFTNDIFNTMSFNPDCLLSGVDEEQMLKTLGFDESDDDISTLLGVGNSSLASTGSSSTSDVMDLDCIQEFLNEEDAVSTSSLCLSVLPQPPLDSNVFPSSPSSSSVSHHDSPSCHSTSPECSFPVESLVSMSGSCSSSVYHAATALYGNCQDFGSCASEIFDV